MFAVSRPPRARIPLGDLWPREVAELLDCVGASTSLEKAATSLESFLARRLRQSLISEPSRELARAMGALGGDEQSVRLREIAKALGLSERHLRRKVEV